MIEMPGFESFYAVGVLSDMAPYAVFVNTGVCVCVCVNVALGSSSSSCVKRSQGLPREFLHLILEVSKGQQ